MLTEFLTRLRFLVTRKAPEEVDEELRSHLEHCAEVYEPLRNSQKAMRAVA